MSEVLEVFDIYSEEFSCKRSVELRDAIDGDALKFVTAEWSPLLKQARDKSVFAFRSLPPPDRDQQHFDKKLAIYGAPDAHWIWPDKISAMRVASQRAFCLADGESIEAMMIVDLSKTSSLTPHSTDDIVYVDYLAVAPWNRKPIQSPPRFRGLGKIMLAVAISLSLDEGFQGRCGLHSVVQSEGFYRNCGMSDGGISGTYPLRYFEFTPDAATKFLED